MKLRFNKSELMSDNQLPFSILLPGPDCPGLIMPINLDTQFSIGTQFLILVKFQPVWFGGKKATIIRLNEEKQINDLFTYTYVLRGR